MFALIGCIAVATQVAPLNSQQRATSLPGTWTPPELDRWAVGEQSFDSNRRDFRSLGTGIGAVGLGLGAGYTAAAVCGNSEEGPRDCTLVTVGVGLAGAAVGGLIGHFLGRAIAR